MERIKSIRCLVLNSTNMILARNKYTGVWEIPQLSSTEFDKVQVMKKINSILPTISFHDSPELLLRNSCEWTLLPNKKQFVDDYYVVNVTRLNSEEPVPAINNSTFINEGLYDMLSWYGFGNHPEKSDPLLPSIIYYYLETYRKRISNKK